MVRVIPRPRRLRGVSAEELEVLLLLVLLLLVLVSGVAELLLLLLLLRGVVMIVWGVVVIQGVAAAELGWAAELLLKLFPLLAQLRRRRLWLLRLLLV